MLGVELPGWHLLQCHSVALAARLTASMWLLCRVQVCQEAEEAVEELRSQDTATRQQLNTAAASLQVRPAIAADASISRGVTPSNGIRLVEHWSLGDVASNSDLCWTCGLQAQIAVLESAIEAATAKAAALKARAEQGDIAQGRLCLAGGPQAGGSSSSPAAAGAAAAGGAQQEDADCPGGQVGLEDLSKAVAAAYQR